MYLYITEYQKEDHCMVHNRLLHLEMNGIATPGQAQESGGFASAAAPTGGVSPHTFPALTR